MGDRQADMGGRHRPSSCRGGQPPHLPPPAAFHPDSAIQRTRALLHSHPLPSTTHVFLSAIRRTRPSARDAITGIPCCASRLASLSACALSRICRIPDHVHSTAHTAQSLIGQKQPQTTAERRQRAAPGRLRDFTAPTAAGCTATAQTCLLSSSGAPKPSPQSVAALTPRSCVHAYRVTWQGRASSGTTRGLCPGKQPQPFGRVRITYPERQIQLGGIRRHRRHRPRGLCNRSASGRVSAARLSGASARAAEVSRMPPRGPAGAE